MAELLDFNRKTLIPPFEDLTFEVLRNLLVKIVNTLYHHTAIQNTILSTFNEELKIRPTYSELIDFVAKRSEPEVLKNTVISFEMVEKVSTDLERKFEVASNINKDTVDDYKSQLKSFRDLSMENFRKIFGKINKQTEDRKGVIKFVRNWKVRVANKMRLKVVLNKWMNIAKNKHKAKAKFRRIFKENDLKRVKKGWNRMKGVYLLLRMKKFEGNSVKALLRADDCQDKLLTILPEVLGMKQTKANSDDLVKLATSVQRINYQSVFNDLTQMIKDESDKLHNELSQVKEQFVEYLKAFSQEIRAIQSALSNPDSNKEINNVKSQLSSLSNMHLLLNERLSRIDFCNKKDDSEFKFEVLTKQLQSLESKVLTISYSQDFTQDQAGYLRSMLNANKAGSRNSMKLSSTAATGMTAFINTPQNVDSGLNVSGVYLRPSKRVSSASPSKQKIYGARRKHNIPSSFSSTLSINETPTFLFNRPV